MAETIFIIPFVIAIVVLVKYNSITDFFHREKIWKEKREEIGGRLI